MGKHISGFVGSYSSLRRFQFECSPWLSELVLETHVQAQRNKAPDMMEPTSPVTKALESALFK